MQALLLLLLPHMDNICLVCAQSAAACARPKPSVHSCILPHTTAAPSSHIPLTPDPAHTNHLSPAPPQPHSRRECFPRSCSSRQGSSPGSPSGSTAGGCWLLPEAECAKVLWPQYRFVCLVSCVSSTSPKYKGAFHMGAEGRLNSSSSSWCRYGETLSSL